MLGVPGLDVLSKIGRTHLADSTIHGNGSRITEHLGVDANPNDQ